MAAPTRRRTSAPGVATLVATALSLLACNQVLGIERAELDPGASHAGTAGAAGGTTPGGVTAGGAAAGGAIAGSAGTATGGGNAGGGVTAGAAGAAGSASGGATAGGVAGGGAGEGAGGAAGFAGAPAGASGQAGGGPAGGEGGLPTGGVSGGSGGIGGSTGGIGGSTGGVSGGSGGAATGGASGGNGGTDCTGADLDTDAAHCGTCGHSCITTGCAGGKCTPEVVDVLVDEDLGGAIAVVGEHLVFGADSLHWLDRADPVGAAIVPYDLDTGLVDRVEQIVVAGSSVFSASTTLGNERVYRGPAAGGDATGYSVVSTPKSLASDGAAAFIGSCASPSAILRWFDESAPVTIATSASLPCADDLFVGGELLWFVSFGSASVFSIPKAPAAVDVTATARAGYGSFGNRAIAVDATHAYVATYYPDFTSEIFRVALSGAPIPELITDAGSQWAPNDIAVDDQYVYWVTLGDPSESYANGSVCRAPKSNPSHAVEVLATGYTRARALLLDGPWVYWVWGAQFTSTYLSRVAR